MNKLITHIGCAVIGAVIGAVVAGNCMQNEITNVLTKVEANLKTLKDLETRLSAVKTLCNMDRETYERKMNILQAENDSLKRQLRHYRT